MDVCSDAPATDESMPEFSIGTLVTPWIGYDAWIFVIFWTALGNEDDWSNSGVF
jgi:hypothetical protein